MKGAGTGTDFDQMMIELQNVSLPPPVEDVLFGIPDDLSASLTEDVSVGNIDELVHEFDALAVGAQVL